MEFYSRIMLFTDFNMLCLLRIMKARQRSFENVSTTSCVPVSILPHSYTGGFIFFDTQRSLGSDRNYKGQRRMRHSSRSSVQVGEMKEG